MLQEIDGLLGAFESLFYGSIARASYEEASVTLAEVVDNFGVPALEELEQRFRNSTFRNSVECRNAFQSALRNAYLERPNEYEQRGVHYFVRK